MKFIDCLKATASTAFVSGIGGYISIATAFSFKDIDIQHVIEHTIFGGVYGITGSLLALADHYIVQSATQYLPSYLAKPLEYSILSLLSIAILYFLIPDEINNFLNLLQCGISIFFQNIEAILPAILSGSSLIGSALYLKHKWDGETNTEEGDFTNITELCNSDELNNNEMLDTRYFTALHSDF